MVPLEVVERTRGEIVDTVRQNIREHGKDMRAIGNKEGRLDVVDALTHVLVESIDRGWDVKMLRSAIKAVMDDQMGQT